MNEYIETEQEDYKVFAYWSNGGFSYKFKGELFSSSLNNMLKTSFKYPGRCFFSNTDKLSVTIINAPILGLKSCSHEGIKLQEEFCDTTLFSPPVVFLK